MISDNPCRSFRGRIRCCARAWKQMPQQAWLDRGERAVTKLTEQLNCLVDAFYLAERTNALEVSSVGLGPLFWRLRHENEDTAIQSRHRSSSRYNECPCDEQSGAARLHPPQSVDQCHKIHGGRRAHLDRLSPQRVAKSGSMYTTRVSAFRNTNCLESSNPSRVLRPNAATVWASGSLSSVVRSRCLATGSKSDRSWEKGRFSRSTRPRQRQAQTKVPPQLDFLRVAGEGQPATYT